MAAAPAAPMAPNRSGAMLDSKIKRTPGRAGAIIFGLALLGGAIYSGSRLVSDLAQVQVTSSLPFILLGFALAIALGFEFVNGFHDTANAVATVIYTHTPEPHLAVVWSGTWNFIGVLTSSGAVAFTVVSLLPVELILRVGSGAGFSMIFALLAAAIIWNLLTWYFGLPNSSSHTMIGSIIGVGLANQFMEPQKRHFGRRLESGPQCLQESALLTADWLSVLTPALICDEKDCPRPQALQRTGRK